MDSLSNLGLTAFLFATASIYLCFFRTSKSSGSLYDSFQLHGRRNVIFSVIRLYVRALTAGPQLARNGYHEVKHHFLLTVNQTHSEDLSLQYNKKGQPVLILDPGLRPNIMLPQEYISWITGQPHSILSSRAVLNEKFATKYFISPVEEKFPNLLMNVLHHDSTRSFAQLQPSLFSEMCESINAN